MATKLKCGCEITDDGKFILGDTCKERNCGECRILTKLHPFGSKRLLDFMLDMGEM